MKPYPVSCLLCLPLACGVKQLTGCSSEMIMTLHTGTICRTAVQCVDPRTGQTGDWLFSGDNHKDANAARSPLFNNLIDLYTWAHANGFESVGDAHIYRGATQPA